MVGARIRDVGFEKCKRLVVSSLSRGCAVRLHQDARLHAALQ